MKILQVLPALGQGGVERGAAEVALALCAAGIPNAVACSRTPGGEKARETLEAAGTECIALPLASKNPFAVAANAKALARIAIDGGFTLMHVRSRAPAWSVRFASRSSGVPFISTWHGLYGTKPRLFKIPYNRVMLSGAATIAVSDCVKRHIVEVYGADGRRIKRIYRGADTRTFRPGAVDAARAAAWRESIGAGADAKVATLPGRLTRWKGQELLIEAAARLAARNRGRAPFLVFAGSDQGRAGYSAHLRALAKEKGVEAAFIDHMEDMPLLYAASDVVVNASSAQPEAFGRVICEAQAMGCIVVGTAHGGACETIEDGKTGFLCAPGDADALAGALAKALDMAPAEREAMSAAAAASVRERFSVARMCEETIAFYRELHESGFRFPTPKTDT